MRGISGNVQPRNKVSVDFDKIGNIDKARTCVYIVPVHERATLKFRLKGVKAARVELIADSVLLSVIVPKYEETWTRDDMIPINFFGEKNFHRGLLDVPVEVRITTDDQEMPSLMVGVVTPSLRWEDISAPADNNVGDEVSTMGGVDKMSTVSGVSTLGGVSTNTNDKEYREDVIVGSDSGEKKLRIIYHRSGCGFIPQQGQ